MPPFAEKPDGLVVIEPLKAFTCAGCGRDDDPLLRLEDEQPFCMTCADLDHLIFLAAGNTALTRRARKASTLSAIVIRWSRSRKRYERQGLLVERAALEAAEEQYDVPRRIWTFRPNSPPRSAGSSRPARANAPRRSPSTPAPAAAAGSDEAPPAAPSRRTPSPPPSSPLSGTRTPSTTIS